MITNNTYYKNGIYIPHAKPSITSDVTTVSSRLDDFIEKYERKCLIKCLGMSLFILFDSELNSSEANGLEPSADVKWDYLLNGQTYTNPSGDLVEWRGIRFKSLASDTLPTVSFLANFVYYHYESNSDGFRSGIGTVKVKGKNAEHVSSSKKVTDAFREMVEMIQGKYVTQNAFTKNNSVGVDFYDEDQEVSLYKFIEDKNKLVADTYPDFKKGYWNEFKNQMGV